MKKIDQLRKNYEEACNAYLNELLSMWELDSFYGYWVGEEVGGLYDYEGGFTINMSNIIYCVENKVKMPEYEAYTDYCVRVHNIFGNREPVPNFPSWHKGCPRHSEEKLYRLERMQKDVEDLIEKERF